MPEQVLTTEWQGRPRAISEVRRLAKKLESDVPYLDTVVLYGSSEHGSARLNSDWKVALLASEGHEDEVLSAVPICESVDFTVTTSAEISEHYLQNDRDERSMVLEGLVLAGEWKKPSGGMRYNGEYAGLLSRLKLAVLRVEGVVDDSSALSENSSDHELKQINWLIQEAAEIVSAAALLHHGIDLDHRREVDKLASALRDKFPEHPWAKTMDSLRGIPSFQYIESDVENFSITKEETVERVRNLMELHVAVLTEFVSKRRNLSDHLESSFRLTELRVANWLQDGFWIDVPAWLKPSLVELGRLASEIIKENASKQANGRRNPLKGLRNSIQRSKNATSKETSKREQTRAPLWPKGPRGMIDMRRLAKRVVDGTPNVQAAILFGSRARKTARRDSDWDVALLAASRHRKEVLLAAPIIPTVNYVSLSPQRLREWYNRLGTLERSVVRDGILLAGEWDPPNTTKRIMVSYPAMSSKLADATGYIQSAYHHLAREKAYRFEAADNLFIADTQKAAKYVSRAAHLHLGVDVPEIHNVKKLADALHIKCPRHAWITTILSLSGKPLSPRTTIHDGENGVNDNVAEAERQLCMVLEFYAEVLEDIAKRRPGFRGKALRLCDEIAATVSNVKVERSWNLCPEAVRRSMLHWGQTAQNVLEGLGGDQRSLEDSLLPWRSSP